ncbi:hypothetical protein [Pseudomonas soli]|uniref:Uncharacterized protein n=1 Tax=Pseudomonas soli TaxID=1306993 RepID=A0AAJ5MG74_9PSED|nr:hypothetical protein [Pseudomonas soli]UXZ42980.1 hypothetical protein K7K07_12900 [Pseudomonas soli]
MDYKEGYKSDFSSLLALIQNVICRSMIDFWLCLDCARNAGITSCQKKFEMM